MTPEPWWRTSAVALGLVTFVAGAAAQRDQPYRDTLPVDHAAIEYEAGPFEDPVAQLAQAVAAGSATFDYDPRFGYLPGLLDRLDIRVDSQVLVFSKTSLQADQISPRTPRAIYFNDAVAVGIAHEAVTSSLTIPATS